MIEHDSTEIIVRLESGDFGYKFKAICCEIFPGKADYLPNDDAPNAQFNVYTRMESCEENSWHMTWPAQSLETNITQNVRNTIKLAATG